ncbi:MAG: YgiT-type zinc finger protein [Candidatus Wallbacteria bacterium]|nr:YgiT-type zinc finger protein [Candidatus Wallbacteria bacterium]
MNCVVCKNPEINMKKVDEEIRTGKDIVLLSLDVLVCDHCGERYYDRATVRKIEEVRNRLSSNKLKCEVEGRVLRAKVA